MKNRIGTLLLLSLIILPLISMINTDTTKHIGTWKAVMEEESYAFVFQENGYAKMIAGKDTMGGESYFLDGEEYELKYSTNYTKSPAYITFNIYFKNSNIRVGSMKGIFKFNTKGEMIICLDTEEGPRPQTFREEDTVTLVKQI